MSHWLRQVWHAARSKPAQTGHDICAVFIAIAASIAEQYPWLVEHGVLDLLIPKKDPMMVAKW